MTYYCLLSKKLLHNNVIIGETYDGNKAQRREDDAPFLFMFLLLVYGRSVDAAKLTTTAPRIAQSTKCQPSRNNNKKPIIIIF